MTATDRRPPPTAPERADRPPALLLIGHGSRDPQGVAEYRALARHVREAAPGLEVACGFTELADPPIDDAVDELCARGADEVVAVPLLLLGAGHLKNDGPATLARARARQPDVHFALGRDLGLDPVVLALTEERIAAAAGRGAEAPAVALIGRGSTDPDANSDLAKAGRLLADGRGLRLVEPGFVSLVEPDVTGALERCARLGARRIVVAPFFLFAGVLVRRIAEQAATWAAANPAVPVAVGAHLGPDPRLAGLLLDRYREAAGGDARMNCDRCVYRVRLPGYDDRVGLPLDLTPHGTGPARGRRRNRRRGDEPVVPAPVRGNRLIPPRTPEKDGNRGAGPSPVDGRAGEPPVLRIAGLRSVQPDGTVALGGVGGVDLSVRRGERVALLGPNGAGKTTLLLHTIGAAVATAGEVFVGRTPVGPASLAEVRRRVGIVFASTEDQLFRPTVAEDVAFGPANLGLAGAELEARVADALADVGAAALAARAPGTLSSGERRRVALAGVLAMRPEIIVLDEPTADLDPGGRQELLGVLSRLDVTLLVATHDLGFAAELCGRAVVLDRGVVVADGPTARVFADPGLLAAHHLPLPRTPWPGRL